MLPFKSAQKGPKRAKISIFRNMAIWDPLSNGTGWNEVGTLRTFRLNSLAHLPDPACPKCGPMGAKKGQK